MRRAGEPKGGNSDVAESPEDVRFNQKVSDKQEPHAPAQRRWLADWIREESFWRDVTIRTISTLVAGVIALLAARTAGLISHVPWATIGKTIISGGVWVTLLAAALSAVLAVMNYRAVSKQRRREALTAKHLRDLRNQAEDTNKRSEAFREVIKGAEKGKNEAE
ncbi:Uncharacterised protein [Mycobacteroides abscessus subsp. bolletii]|nr:Uncharacterised protein [Mycobacteroides abscessus subsp. bolletii]SKH05858.1 Uncharacterised protein [Mycobacteroides abscessus subsp. bolletii]